MSFYGQFMSRFTREEQNTEVVKAWAAIGVDTEKTLLEQINMQVRSMSDINGFYPDLYRSWLAFFLRRIPNSFAPRTIVTVTNPATSDYPVDIKSSYDENNPSQLAASGVKFIQPVDITLVPGSSVSFESIQGTIVHSTGTYSEIIAISTSKVDMSTIQLKLNGVEIQPVSLMTSWSGLKFMNTWVPAFNDKYPDPDNPSPQDPVYMSAVHLYDGIDYEHKGDFYLVTADGTATIKNLNDNTTRQEKFYAGQYIVYNGKTWNKSLNEPSFLPNQMDKSYAIPFDGYFAYYQDNLLYVKIFPGPATADPEGGSYDITFIDTDGSQGVVPENVLAYTAQVLDTYGNPVDVVVKNTRTTVGYSVTEAGELSSILRDRLFSAINISSIPEYTAFFNAQPEVGDCRVMSDFEESITTGDYIETGFVSVFLLDTLGEPITSESTVAAELLERVSLYKDVAAISLVAADKVESVIRLKYYSSTDDTAFTTFATSVVNSFYNMNFLKQHGFSLFEDLDLFQLVQYIGDTYNPIGLVAEAYHFLKFETFEGVTVTAQPYLGEAIGEGYYLYFAQTGGTSTEPEYAAPVKFIEILNRSNTSIANVCLEDGTVIGSRTATELRIENSASGYVFGPGYMECYWPMKDKGILTVGKSTGVRSLSKECSSGAIRVERYR